MILTRHIILIAGEASGDMHAAHLVKELKRLDPSLSFSGIGGPEMQKAGVEIYQDLTKIAVVGFVEVLKHFSHFKKAFRLILDKIREIRPAGVILVDYPGFNLRLAPKIKNLGIKVIYYISPQVWAWKKNRVKIIQKYVDRMLVLFPFEKDFYARLGVEVSFVGHPLADAVKAGSAKQEFLSSQGLDPSILTIGLLPGSRQREIEVHLPLMLKAASLLQKEFPSIRFLILQAPSAGKELIEGHTKQFPSLPLKILENKTYAGINASDLCIVASGTATLETAILGKPMVVIYKTSFLTWILARFFIRIPYIALVNVVAGKKVVPECIQFEATAEHLAEEIKNLISDDKKIREMKEGFQKIRESLGQSGASARAAQEVLRII